MKTFLREKIFKIEPSHIEAFFGGCEEHHSATIILHICSLLLMQKICKDKLTSAAAPSADLFPP